MFPVINGDFLGTKSDLTQAMIWWYDSEKVIEYKVIVFLSQNELLTYLWYLNLGYTFKGLKVIQRFNNNDNND